MLHPIVSSQITPLTPPSAGADQDFLKQFPGAFQHSTLGGRLAGTPNGGAVSTAWTPMPLQGGIVCKDYQGLGAVFIATAEIAWDEEANIGSGDTVLEVRVVPAGTSLTAPNTAAYMLGAVTPTMRSQAGYIYALYQNPDLSNGAYRFNVAGKVLEFQARFTGITPATADVSGIHMSVRLHGFHAAFNNRGQV